MAWVFLCKKGLAQDNCGRYEVDKSSPGYKNFLGGCPSCKHRKKEGK